MSDPQPPGPRTPDEVRRDGNRLAREASLYLRQHARNPIDWYPWGEEALARAREHDLPVFLSVGYSSCHWCHVMEREVFEHDDVAAMLNQKFVPIKVDREERPDLDATYMAAVQAMTQRGGWPMSVFLTPKLEPFFGGTYFPHPQFMEILRQLDEAYRTRRDEITGFVSKLVPHLTALVPASDEKKLVSMEFHDAVVAKAEELFDPEWAGFKSQMKFPTPLRWRYLLLHHRKTGSETSARLVRETLDAMASGGIRDHVGGGFHRYTVDERWVVPHFEKMLYDNAQLASLYVEAAATFDEPRYEAVARDTLDFLLREMCDERGAFHASIDADSGDSEGSYYVWTPDDITAIAGEADGLALCLLLDVLPEGNFEGKTVLTRRIDLDELARDIDRPVEELRTLFDQWRPALRQARAKRDAPTRDTKIVTAWNGLAIEALALAARAFDEPRYADAARRAADHLWSAHHQGSGRMARASTDGTVTATGILDDHADLAVGLVALFEATGDLEILKRALTLDIALLRDFSREEGGFYQTASDGDAPLARRVEVLDSVEPSGNSAAVVALFRAALLTGRQDLGAAALRTLTAYSPIVGKAGLEMPGWLSASLLAINPFREVVIAGNPGASDTRALRRGVDRVLPPYAVVVPVPPGGLDDDTARILPPAAGKTARDGHAAAYVCERGRCQAPTSDPQAMLTALREGWAR
jgi:hypothetical protein